MSSFKTRLQNAIDSTFEPTTTVKSTQSSFYDLSKLEYYDINYSTLKSIRKSNIKTKIEPETPMPAVFNTPKSKSVLKREKSGNKLKDKALDYISTSPRIDFIHFNKPSISTSKLYFDHIHYDVNSPNNYKKNYYSSHFCRDYKEFKLTPSVYSPRYQSKSKVCDKGKDFFREKNLSHNWDRNLSSLDQLKHSLRK